MVLSTTNDICGDDSIVADATGPRSALPSFAPKIRVEVYVPIRYEPAYQDTLSWLIEEFTELRGGCTVNENVCGYYLSQSNEVIDDRVSVVYSKRY